MSNELTVSEAVRLRKVSLLLAGRGRARTVAEVAAWFGAMQAQDLASGKWSFGVRLPGTTEADVDRAIAGAEVLRTWPMRGTLHFIPAEDARWMLELTGTRALAGAAKRREFLGLDEKLALRAGDLLGQALAGGRRLTRAAAVELWHARGLEVMGQVSYHLLWFTSQRGITCVGPNEGSEQTFVLLSDWAPRQRTPERDEALALLATRYFRSHGPATQQDFTGWTGLTAADAKRAIALAGKALTAVTVAGKTHTLGADTRDADDGSGPVAHALLGFDELMLGVKDRSLVIGDGDLERIVPGRNGVFRPTMEHGGRVIGTWTRTVKKTSVAIEAAPFGKVTRSARAAFEAAAAEYARFLGRTATVSWG